MLLPEGGYAASHLCNHLDCLLRRLLYSAGLMPSSSLLAAIATPLRGDEPKRASDAADGGSLLAAKVAVEDLCDSPSCYTGLSMRLEGRLFKPTKLFKREGQSWASRACLRSCPLLPLAEARRSRFTPHGSTDRIRYSLHNHFVGLLWSYLLSTAVIVTCKTLTDSRISTEGAAVCTFCRSSSTCIAYAYSTSILMNLIILTMQLYV